ncbi:MAG: ABC transporter ATP-binding protein [Pseudomonadota bacterium]
MAEVTVENLTKIYGATRALDDVSLDFADGEFFGLLGPSGSGKTTLLRAIAGFIAPESGRIRIGGVSVERLPVERRDIGMMFQSYALFPNMSVADNVGFGLRVRKVGRAEEARRIGEALELVQLENLGQRRPHELSGGQRQRVALARAFVTNPRVLLLDEPLSALDKSLRLDMQIELKRIQREIGITTIFVTHDQDEALTLSDRIGILRDGALVQAGPPREVYGRPGSVFVASFLGEANIFDAEIEAGKLRLPGGGFARLPPGSEGAAAFALRPESIEIGPAPGPEADGFEAILIQRVYSGPVSTLIVEAGGDRFRATVKDTDLPDLVEGVPIALHWDPSALIPIPKP